MHYKTAKNSPKSGGSASYLISFLVLSSYYTFANLPFCNSFDPLVTVAIPTPNSSEILCWGTPLFSIRTISSLLGISINSWGVKIPNKKSFISTSDLMAIRILINESRYFCSLIRTIILVR